MRAWQVLQRWLALALLVPAAPILGVVAVMIRVDTPGPIVYRATRVGLGGRPIVIHKLRTMRDDAGRDRSVITSASDPRVTRVGSWLRRRRLDEVPQLWDVARGRMGLVGPRPEDPSFVDLDDPRWQAVLTIRPGLTGEAQLAFHDEASLLTGPDPSAAYRELVLPGKLATDLDYVRGRSVRGDLRILAATLGLVLGRDSSTENLVP